MTATQRFHLGDILTITTGRLVSPRGMDAVYDVLNWMTGDDLFTHQLPRAMDECQPHLLAQHPDLAGIKAPDFDAIRPDRAEAWIAAWLARRVAQFGEHREVAPLPAGEHTRIDPLAELVMNHPHLTVLPVVLPSSEDGAA